MPCSFLTQAVKEYCLTSDNKRGLLSLFLFLKKQNFIEIALMLKDSHDKRALFSCFVSPLPKPMDMHVRLKGYSNLSIDKNGSVNDCLALCLSWDTLRPLCDLDLYTN